MRRFIVTGIALWLDLIVPVYDAFNRTKSWSSPFHFPDEPVMELLSGGIFQKKNSYRYMNR